MIKACKLTRCYNVPKLNWIKKNESNGKRETKNDELVFLKEEFDT